MTYAGFCFGLVFLSLSIGIPLPPPPPPALTNLSGMTTTDLAAPFGLDRPGAPADVGGVGKFTVFLRGQSLGNSSLDESRTTFAADGRNRLRSITQSYLSLSLPFSLAHTHHYIDVANCRQSTQRTAAAAALVLRCELKDVPGGEIIGSVLLYGLGPEVATFLDVTKLVYVGYHY